MGGSNPMRIIFIICLLVFTFTNMCDCKRTLETHGVDMKTQKAIQGMTASGIPHKNIQDNIQRHYPDKPKHVIHDIIVESNAAGSGKQARQLDNKRETSRKLSTNKKTFDEKLTKMNKVRGV